MFSAGRILRQNRRLSSFPAESLLDTAARSRRKEKRRKFRCYLPFMWSAFAMSFLGITIIVTGTAMCVAGWYLGHFGDDAFRPEPSSGSQNASYVGETSAVVGVLVDIPPARGLAYAGPVVMSFGCFAVVFACVVVCETRDRVLETMEDRIRRGLPARPPGGIQADFYALVVEVRKRRVERQRHGRKLLQSDDELDYAEERSGVECATSPLQPTPTSVDFISPSTIKDFVADYTDEPSLPALRVEHPDEMSVTTPGDRLEDSPDRWCLNPASSDNPCSRSVDVRLGAVTPSTSPGSRQAARHAGQNLSPSWQPTTMPQSSQSSLSCDIDMSSTDADPAEESGSTVVRSTGDQPRESTSSLLPFPLLAPISSLTQSLTLPYVRLDSSSESFAAPTYLVHTASVHAIADRSPDLVPRPNTTLFDFPPTDFRYGSDVTSGNVTAASDQWTSGTSSALESRFVADTCADGRDVTSDRSLVDDVIDVRGSENVELSHPLRDGSDGGFAESHAAAADDELPVLSVVNQTNKRHHEFDTAQPPSCDDTCLERLSSYADDVGPSRKRSRGTVRQQVLSAVDDDSASLFDPSHVGSNTSSVCPHVGSNTSSVCPHVGSNPSSVGPHVGSNPSSVCPHVGSSPSSVGPHVGSNPSSVGPRLICGGERWSSAGDTSGSTSLLDDARNAVCPRPRRPNGMRHLLSSRGRRQRPDNTTSRRNFDEDLDRRLTAHHSVNELDSFLLPTTTFDGDRSTDRPATSDELSQLIWQRRRTTAASPRRPAADPCQSTV